MTSDRPFHARAALRVVAALAATVAVGGCSSPEPTAEPVALGTSSAAATTAAGVVTQGKVEWVKVPPGAEPHAWVKSEVERARADQKKLVLYVGAKWCEPCQHFHEATERGELDAAFPDLRLVQFDHDDEAATIAELGCGSNYIPLFSVPDADGHCTRKQIQGGIKGTNNVAFLTDKLRKLIGP